MGLRILLERVYLVVVVLPDHDVAVLIAGGHFLLRVFTPVPVEAEVAVHGSPVFQRVGGSGSPQYMGFIMAYDDVPYLGPYPHIIFPQVSIQSLHVSVVIDKHDLMHHLVEIPGIDEPVGIHYIIFAFIGERGCVPDIERAVSP
jgi:hypothetical protein